MRPANNKRIAVLDLLRGIAALSVAVLHFTNGNPTFLPSGVVKSIGSKGYLGVEVFFVISGFVIPYALNSANYTIRNYPRFVLKRIVRLDPPYIASIILVLALGFLAASTPGFHGQPYQPSLIQVLLHLGYVNVFFGYPWLNDAYWTLAIELQYYLLIGLLFPLIRNYWLPLFVSLGALAFLIRSNAFIFQYLFLFMMGIATFRYYVGLTTKRVYLVVVTILAVGTYLTLGGWILGAGLFSALTIAFVRTNPLRFFGLISYSLYLVHVPIGMKFVDLSARFVSGYTARLLIVLMATALSCLAAYLLYYFVERPSQQWAKRITYENDDALVVGSVGSPSPASPLSH